MFEQLVLKCQDLPNVVLINKAVSDFDGKSKFNISNDLDHGSVSSLLDFADDVHSKWPGKEKYFEYIDEIDIDCIRMDNFVKSFGIKQIDYFHCDAQGSDFKILQGFGDQISLIKAGCCEAGIIHNAVYKNQPMIDEVVTYLLSKNFTIKNIEKNDPLGNEANIHFVNKN
jgi:FkbM family methyltransferase